MSGFSSTAKSLPAKGGLRVGTVASDARWIFSPASPREQLFFTFRIFIGRMNRMNFHSAEISALCDKYHVKSVRIFGSMARSQSNHNSDIDLLVTFSKPTSLLQMVKLERELSAIIGRKVDLLTLKSVSPYLRTRILKESLPLYAA